MTVYVFGLGHIGLPMATWIALHDYTVIGIDTNPKVIQDIQNGTVNIEEFYQKQHISQLALHLMKENKLKLSSQFSRENREPSIFVIAVGIVDQADGTQDVSPLISVLKSIIPQFVPGDLLLFRTTLIPGTLDHLITEYIRPLNLYISIAYCPETLMETRAFEELEQNSMILAALDDTSLDKAEFFLRSLTHAPLYKATSLKAAEMVKVLQNIHRDVNIALINEMSEAAHALDLDIYELITLANTHPRVTLLKPGPGVGGYCLPNALAYLQHAVGGNCPLTLMSTARSLNTARPLHIVKIVKKTLENVGKALPGSTIALIGLAMKDYCADCRHSPAIEIASLLVKEGATVQAYDPKVPIMESFQVPSLEAAVLNADCLLITAQQDGVIYDLEQLEALMAKPLLVIDTRNNFPDFPNMKIFKA
jgi:UDP-N-acetyl-D-mannosaminuronic acid dehydrogenase